MSDLTIFDFALRLATGVVGGALIGVERQWRARLAGVRTNALVGAGATLFVLYSEAVGDVNSPTRVASYVVSGIGFLGGGVILREGMSVRGLNTAATLWCSAAIGVLAASGRLDLSLLGAATVIVIHLVLRPAGRLFRRADRPSGDEAVRVALHTTCGQRDEAHVRALLVRALGSADARLTALRIHRTDDTTDVEATLALDGDPGAELGELLTRLSLEPGIHDLHWHVIGEATRTRPDPGTDAGTGTRTGADAETDADAETKGKTPVAEPVPSEAPAPAPAPAPAALRPLAVPVGTRTSAPGLRMRAIGVERRRNDRPGEAAGPGSPRPVPAVMSVVAPGAPKRTKRPGGAGSRTTAAQRNWTLTNDTD